VIGPASMRIALSLGVLLLGGAATAWPQARQSPARRPPARAPAPPALSVRLLKVGTVDARSARERRPFGPTPSAVVVEIGAPAAGLTARIDRTTVTATAGDTVLPASYVFIVGGDRAIVDALATRDAVAWETVIGAETRHPLGPAVGLVLDLRQGDWIEYRFTRSGVLRLAVVFDAPAASLARAVVAGTTLDVARTPLSLTGQWEGSFRWSGAVGRLRFTVDSVSSEIADLVVALPCRETAVRRRGGAPSSRPALTVERPAPLAPIHADRRFALDPARTLFGGTGRFVTADSAVGAFTGTEVFGCVGSRGVALRGPWTARRSAPTVPPRPRYAFAVDTTAVPFAIRDARLLQPRCGAVQDAGEFEMQPAQAGFNVRPPGGQIEISEGNYCIWPHGAVHRWVGTHNAVAGPIRSIRSESAAPLRFRVHRDSGYVYVGGMGTLTTTDGQAVELPLSARLVGENPEIATLRRPEAWEFQNVAHDREACEGGHLLSCTSLGMSYRQGLGVWQSDVRAVELYRRACDGGEMSGCSNLGWMYAYGRGVPQSETRAVELFRQACAGGEPWACSRMRNASPGVRP
jgi:hypothetical protein